MTVKTPSIMTALNKGYKKSSIQKVKNTQNQNFDPTKPKRTGKMIEHDLLNTFLKKTNKKGLRILKFDVKIRILTLRCEKTSYQKISKRTLFVSNYYKSMFLNIE